MRGRAAGMDDPLRDPLVIEVGDLLPEVEVLQQGRPALAGLQRMIGVGQPQALRGGQELARLVLAGDPMIRRPWRGACASCRYWRDEAIFSPVTEGQAMASPGNDHTGEPGTRQSPAATAVGVWMKQLLAWVQNAPAHARAISGPPRVTRTSSLLTRRAASPRSQDSHTPSGIASRCPAFPGCRSEGPISCDACLSLLAGCGRDHG